MKLKLDDQGHAVIQDGKPVFVHDDGKEVAIDVPAMQTRIGDLNEESKNHRLKAKDATEKLAGFEGIEDAEAARKALTIVKDLEDKKLIDAGEAEKVKAEIKQAYEEKLAEAGKALTAKEGEVFKLMVGGAFGNSEFVGDKLTVPADMVQAMFGSQFKVEEGKVVAYDGAGSLGTASSGQPPRPQGQTRMSATSCQPHVEMPGRTCPQLLVPSQSEGTRAQAPGAAKPSSWRQENRPTENSGVL